MKIEAHACDWREAIELAVAERKNSAFADDEAWFFHYVCQDEVDSHVAVLCDRELTVDEIGVLWDAGDLYLLDKTWEGETLAHIVGAIRAHVEDVENCPLCMGFDPTDDPKAKVCDDCTGGAGHAAAKKMGFDV